MYPMLCDGVGFRVEKEKGKPNRFFVENADGDEFRISRTLFNALQKADGTRPLCLPDHGEKLLPELKRNGLIHTSRFVKGVFSTDLFYFRLATKLEK